jgi:uncharacterized protein YndB with AHSA1/START domain
MVDIFHRVGMKDASPDDVYAALTTIDGLAGWWTTDTSGDAEPGGTIAFRFGPGGFDMRVLAARPGEHVLWEVVDGPAEWVGTTIRWDIRREEEWTIVLFAHEGWKEPVEFLSHCSTKWATFLLSLKALVETGTGAPEPHDLEVSNWH